MRKRCNSYKLCANKYDCTHHNYHECDEDDDCIGICGELNITTFCVSIKFERKMKIEELKKKYNEKIG